MSRLILRLRVWWWGQMHIHVAQIFVNHADRCFAFSIKVRAWVHQREMNAEWSVRNAERDDA